VVQHVVWDWNGTLLDDLDVVVSAVNDTLATVNRAPITIREYGANYTRPVLRFYERLLGRAVTNEEWLAFDDAFHESYGRLVESAGLADDALEALNAASASGVGQSLLSMYWHDELIPQVERFGLNQFLIRVDGLRGTPGDKKVSYLERHIREVETARATQLDPAAVLVIGDALDDADAARTLGMSCVLYDGGSHPAEQLESAGLPVVGSLMEALKAGGVLPPSL
jgi:phosphoglycolate phosphatase-like HAD superfamily hydrolase